MPRPVCPLKAPPLLPVMLPPLRAHWGSRGTPPTARPRGPLRLRKGWKCRNTDPPFLRPSRGLPAAPVTPSPRPRPQRSAATQCDRRPTAAAATQTPDTAAGPARAAAPLVGQRSPRRISPSDRLLPHRSRTFCNRSPRLGFPGMVGARWSRRMVPFRSAVRLRPPGGDSVVALRAEVARLTAALIAQQEEHEVAVRVYARFPAALARTHGCPPPTCGRRGERVVRVGHRSQLWCPSLLDRGIPSTQVMRGVCVCV